MRRVQFGFYNLAPAGDPNRGIGQVTREAEAIVNNQPHNPLRRRPKVFGVVEAIGRNLPHLDHYEQVSLKANRSVANLALYVRADLHRKSEQWIMHTREWKRPLHPGMHEPRATLVVPVEDWTIVVAHAPQAPMRHLPAEVNDTLEAARGEWLDVVAEQLRRPGPVLLLSDSNGLWDDLLRRVEGVAMAGTPIESAHARHATLRRIRTPGSLGGVQMLSDHKRCLLGTAIRA